MPAYGTTPASFNGATITDDISAWIAQAVTVAVFCLAVAGFVVTVKNCVGAYSEIQDGKGTWGKLGLMIIVGAALLTFSIFLLIKANGVIFVSGTVSPVVP
ncbi:TIGR03745 family integrating conjugative element membrane protein [Motilimonas cestriensis]|uniref:TIGR03745 family integrating conjugative element membrane protein n=1 Tax=Motilimonas cestriensis TaxID=2742685 RepID=UPI003DA3BDD7